jgi:hypothetical protein
MGLEITMRVPLGPTEEQYRPDRRLWLTADGKRVVEDGDPDAAILYATPATLVPMGEAQKYGLVPKKRAKPADKQLKREHEDKGTETDDEEVEYYEDMKVDRLKKLLTERGLEDDGKKQELIDRLVEDDDKQKEAGDG